MRTRPLKSIRPNMPRMASEAAPSAWFLSPLPKYFQAASAAFSVQRTRSRSMTRSGSWRMGGMVSFPSLRGWPLRPSRLGCPQWILRRRMGRRSRGRVFPRGGARFGLGCDGGRCGGLVARRSRCAAREDVEEWAFGEPPFGCGDGELGETEFAQVDVFFDVGGDGGASPDGRSWSAAGSWVPTNSAKKRRSERSWWTKIVRIVFTFSCGRKSRQSSGTARHMLAVLLHSLT